MKKSMFLFGALFAVGLSFTACSSDNDVADNNGPIDNGGGNYLAISINLPTNPASVTRTTDNNGGVTYDDGLATEYAVDNATLIIFNSTGTFVEAHDIDTKPWTSSSDDNVTRVSTKIVQKVSGSVAANYQMLVILNDNGLIDVTASNGLEVFQSGKLTAFSGTYDQFQALTTAATTSGLDCGSMNTTGFYMANAPLANTQGSTSTAITGASVRVLVPITNVYDSESAASAGTADQIYVERGMAKVTMDGTITTPTLSNSKIDGTSALTASLTGWTLDNCNPVSYLVRSTEGHSDFLNLYNNSTTVSTGNVYRYIGNTAITEGSPTTYKYRTYFAKSANYDKTTSLNRVTPSTTFSTNYGETNPQYCFENTFAVADQDVDKTTLVQVAVQAINGTAQDLYTVNGNKTTIYTMASLTTLIQSKAYDYIMNNSYVKSGTLNSTDFTPTLTVNSTTNEVTAVSLAYSGSATVSGSALEGGADATTGTLISAASTYVLGELGTILKYVNGISYYNIRIKHFGDILTPWNKGETTTPSTGTIYPTDNADKNYLGRYGVLRNNWYHLQISSIKNLGDAVPQTSTWPDTPDDELDNYITFQINVLSWAKRTQGADL